MFKRPKPGEDEDDILKMQEEFLREKNKNQDLQPAAQVTNLRWSESNKRPSSSDTERKPSKYAQSKGLKNHSEKRVRIDDSISIMGDILEKNTEKLEEGVEAADEDDKVYYPKVIPFVLGDIVEKNVDKVVEVDVHHMPAQGFPTVTKWDPNAIVAKKIPSTSKPSRTKKLVSNQMDIDTPSSSKVNLAQQNSSEMPKNLPTKSYMLTSKEADDIHNENVKTLNKLSETEILAEQQKLLSSLDPKLIEFFKSKRQQRLNDEKSKLDSESTEVVMEKMDTAEDFPDDHSPVDDDSLWENDVLSNPEVNKWLHFDSLEKDKLEWMKGIAESKKVKPDEPYEARFNFKGYLLPYTMEYTEKTKSLFHHGEEPHRPGYSLSELFQLSRSAVPQQRVMALNTIAGILEYYSAGTYKDIIDLPLSKIFFVVRFAMDENKKMILEPALKAMRNLIYNRIDEASLDALIGFEEGTLQPYLENDKSEVEELQSKESEFTDYHIAEIDIVTALLRTDILQHLFYIFETIKPSFNCIQYSLQILTRLARDSPQAAQKIVQTDHLMKSIFDNFIPTSSLSFAFIPQIVYNGKPILAALKLLRILSLQSEIVDTLVNKFDILKPVSEYVSSGVDGTYGIRIQIEAYCILANLLKYNYGIDNALSLSPVVTTTLYKHVQGTDVFAKSSVVSATHAAVVLQFLRGLMNGYSRNLEALKHQVYPLLKEGVQKWIAQLSYSDNYTCGHLRLLCSALDCCKIVLLLERVPLKFLNDSLKELSTSNGFREIVKNLVPSSNLLSGIENKDLHLPKNVVCLGTSVIDSTQKILPILSVTSPIPFLASLLNCVRLMEDKDVYQNFISCVVTKFMPYLACIANKAPSLCDNWFTRLEIDFLFSLVKICVLCDIPDVDRDLLYRVSNKLCYILRIYQKYELEFILNVVFNRNWFTAERLLNVMSISDANCFSRALTSIEEIKNCYRRAIETNYRDMSAKITGMHIPVGLRKWREPILPRDWIYLPILMLYGRSQEAETRIQTRLDVAHNELIVACSLEWILFNELCFPDLLHDLDVTDRFCRIMCVFLCDNSLFLDAKIKILLQKCVQVLFKRRTAFNFDRQLTGLHNFQDFYTQFLEQFQSVSYGDATFAACVLVPIAQQHDVKWRKLLWSEYAGCLLSLNCPPELLCYELRDYLYPEETDESLIKSYFHALSTGVLRQNTIAYKIASHHTTSYKNRKNVSNR